MRVEEFPRPKDDNRRGVHWSASIYHLKGTDLDFWINELQAMHVKWLKLMDDGGGSSLELCQRLLAADIMPIVRLYRGQPNPGHIGGREEDTARRLIAAGVRYFETNNEPDLPAEWREGRMPPNWLDVVIDNFIIDADRIIGMGGLPALPAMGVGSKNNPVERVAAKGRADLFEKGAWVAIHNYTLNHPLDYPYDPVNQQGAPVSQEEYDRLGKWAWDSQPRELINQWRASDKNTGATLNDDPVCFLAFYLMDQMIVKALGHKVPIISTEGGPVMGWRDDRRYPRLDPDMHAEWVVTINDFMQGGREINGIRCPNNYFTMCHWLLGNGRLGFLNITWESQSWYTNWWDKDFGLKGELPVVAALKAMPNRPVDGPAGEAVIRGQLLRVDTGQPLSGLIVRLLSGSLEAASATSAADGSFQMENLSPGVYDLAIDPWGVVRRDVTAATGPTDLVVIRLPGGTSSVLTGQVLDSAGAPKQSARVSLSRYGVVTGEVTTAGDGAFRFSNLPLGSYQLSVPGITVSGIALDGWASKSVKLTAGVPPGYRYGIAKRRLLPADETAGRRLLYGTVSDANGAPLNGIKLQMSWKDAAPGTQFPTTTTGKDPFKPAGTYEFVTSPGLFRLQVVQGDWPSDAAEDLDTARVPGREGQPITYEVNFQLQAVGSSARVDGLVTGGQTGQKISLIGPAAVQEATLGSDGIFAFANLAPATYRLELWGVGVIADEVLLEAGSLYRLIFPLQSRLSGQVLGAADGLLAVLYAPAAWGWTRQAPLDPAGNFSFDGLPPGRYRLEVADQVLPDLELTGENNLQLAPVDIGQGRRSVLSGRVVDGAGHPMADVLLILRRDGLEVAQIRTAADGTYRFANLLAGTYSLEAAGMGEIASGIALDGEQELIRDLTWVPPPPLGLLRGRVLAADGAPQLALVVHLLHDGVEIARTQTDNLGAFQFTGLAAGLYDLAVGEDAPIVSGVRLEEGATLIQDIILPPAQRKPIVHYVLLGPPLQPDAGVAETAETRLVLALAMRYLRRTGASSGFSLADATQAAQVIIVGDRVPQEAEQTLRTAGCEVQRLSGDGYAIAAAFNQLLKTLGEG